MFSSQDAKTLKKIGVQNLLDLALYVPKGYENNHLFTQPVFGIENLFDVAVHDVRKERRLLKVFGEIPALDLPLEIVYFNYSSYHVKTFHEKERLYLKGKLEQRGSKLQMLQPKFITEINTIVNKYATKSLRAMTIDHLKTAYLHSAALTQEGLSESQATLLLQIHFPTAEFVNHFKRLGMFPPEHLKALKFTEIYHYLRRLSGKKSDFESLGRLNYDENAFVFNLPFELTNDQKKAIAQIKADLDSDMAAKRVIMGDVGCGKTMVMLAASVMAYPHKTLLMAPTTILANQLFEEACKHLPKEMKVSLLTQEKKKEIDPDAHLIIGTHAILYADPPEAPLVMIDEQHRFGTNQRNLLEKLVSGHDGKRPHVLQFSATPIPRTMAMIDSALVDFSFIKEIPFPKDITTRVITKPHFKELMVHIKNEIGKGYQVIIVYPLVGESEVIDYMSLEEAESFWKKNFENVYVTHGKDKEKDSVLKEFREKGSILLSTTVVEVGISLPDLTTIVVAGAERLGLATLHQLRGRVSRTGKKGYCFLYTNLKESERLEKFSKTMSGFDIAELDLKYRESGDLLTGAKQSGKQFEWIDLAEDVEIVREAKEILDK